MRLHVLASGSKGNAFAIEAAEGTLLLDAGLSAKEWTRRAEQVGLDLGRLVGIALTHEHGDHASGAILLARRHGVPLVATDGTIRALGEKADGLPSVPIRGTSVTELGPFSVSCCRVLHDAADPAALVVEADGRRVGLAYDFGRPTVGLRYLLRDCDALVVEANYDEVMLRTSGYPASVQHRIAGSGGHLSNSGAALLLADLLHDDLEVIVLAHLSQQCNAPDVARSTVEPYLRERGFKGTLAVAIQDEPIAPLAVRRSDRGGRSQVELGLF
jgi:phosphoribosyl 1,2-cyclic phosphodiesterase